MAQDYYVISVDMKGSSNLDISPEQLEPISRVLESYFRFCHSSSDLPDNQIFWAGDGGYSLFLCSDKSNADKAFNVIKTFVRYIPDFMSKKYLNINFNIIPQFRIMVGKSNIAPSMRLSNYAGSSFSFLLKYEREFGLPNNISVFKEFYNDLSNDNKELFDNPRLIKDKNIYDCTFETIHKFGISNIALAVKEDIDKSTIGFFYEGIDKMNKNEFKNLWEVIEHVFSTEEFIVETLDGLHILLSDNLIDKSIKLCYIKKEIDALYVKYVPEKQKKSSISILNNSHLSNQVFISGEAKFENDVIQINKCNCVKNKCKSIACIPIFSKFANQEKIIHGVVCIHSNSETVFNEEFKKSIIESVKPIIHSLIIAEMFGILIKKFEPSKN